MGFLNLRRKIRVLNRRSREVRMVANALKSPRHPILAHMIPIRRCNLACTYCNEFDSVSAPVPTEEMFARIDRLAALGTAVITLSGGEPLLHPDVVQIIRHIRNRGSIAELITNGYLLTVARIKELNTAGLDHLQISIDNVKPDDVSKKSLKVLDKKLQMLAEHAEFDVNINSVIGSGVRNAEDAFTVASRAHELGFGTTLGIIHDAGGQLRPLSELERDVYRRVKALDKRQYARWDWFQRQMIEGKPRDWACRAGSRYLYICEDGLVHYCSQQRGYPAVPLETYTQADLDREYNTVKSCAPYCTISCVQRGSMIDEVRDNPAEAIARYFPAGGPTPTPVRILTWLFLPRETGGRRIFRRAALRVLRVK